MGSVDKGLPLAEFSAECIEHLPDSQNFHLDAAKISIFSLPCKFSAIFLCHFPNFSYFCSRVGLAMAGHAQHFICSIRVSNWTLGK